MRTLFPYRLLQWGLFLSHTLWSPGPGDKLVSSLFSTATSKPLSICSLKPPSFADHATGLDHPPLCLAELIYKCPCHFSTFPEDLAPGMSSLSPILLMLYFFITNFNSHIDDLSCISDPVPGPPLLQWSCPLAPSATKLPVSLSLRLSYTWMFSINSISNTSFSTVLQLTLSRFPIPSILQQLQDLYSSDPMPSS